MEDLLFGLLISIPSFILILLGIRNLSLSKKILEDGIQEFYHKKGYQTELISELDLVERMRYGVPVFFLFRIYNYYFGIFTGKIEYVRKVYLSKGDNREHTRYIELTVSRRKIIDLREFK